MTSSNVFSIEARVAGKTKMKNPKEFSKSKKSKKLYLEARNVNSTKFGFDLNYFGFEYRDHILSSSGSFENNVCEANNFQLIGLKNCRLKQGLDNVQIRRNSIAGWDFYGLILQFHQLIQVLKITF